METSHLPGLTIIGRLTGRGWRMLIMGSAPKPVNHTACTQSRIEAGTNPRLFSRIRVRLCRESCLRERTPWWKGLDGKRPRDHRRSQGPDGTTTYEIERAGDHR